MTSRQFSMHRPVWRLRPLGCLLGALLGGAGVLPATAHALPLAPATVAPPSDVIGGPATTTPDPARDAAVAVAALQQQIAAQQAQLQALQQRLAQLDVTGKPAAAVTTAPGGQVQPVQTPSAGAATSPAPTSGSPASTRTAPPTASFGGQVVAQAATGISGAPSSVPPAATPSASVPGHPDVEPSAGGVSGAAAATPTPLPEREASPPASGDENTLPLTTEAQRQAYASGVNVWRDIESSLATQRGLGIELDRRYLMAGLQDMYAHRSLRMGAPAMEAAMTALNAQYSGQAQAVREHQETEGRAYRVAFGKRKGAFIDAGAWYLVADKGKGRHLRTTDRAVLSVTGTLPDGTVFDASGQNGQNKTVKVGALLPAVAIGLQKVGVGGHVIVVVPPQKGYGDAGLPPAIPGGATLIFDVTVKGVGA